MNSEIANSNPTKLTYEQMYSEAKNKIDYDFELYKIDICEQIYQAMARGKINKSQFAEKLRVSKGRITQILSGDTNFTIETLIRISNILSTEIRLTIRPMAWEKIFEFEKISCHDFENPSSKTTLDLSSDSNKKAMKTEELEDAFSTAA